MDGNSILWVVAMVVFFAVEALTFNLTTIWFAIGSVAGFVLSMLDFSLTAQISCFLVASFILLIFTKPFAEKKLKPKKEATNSDMLIGKTGIVIEDISPEKFAGEIKIKGQVWSAVTPDGSLIEKGTTVVVKSIDGVKLVVEKEN